MNIDTPDTILVVRDGESPEAAARIIDIHLKNNGYQTVLMDADAYDHGCFYFARAIIVGHHDLAKTMLRLINPRGLVELRFGLKYNMTPACCVLRAKRSDLKGTADKRAFAACYDKWAFRYRGLANQYGIPLSFGKRQSTRESQYDLLLLMFLSDILPEFLRKRAAMKELGWGRGG